MARDYLAELQNISSEMLQPQGHEIVALVKQYSEDEARDRSQAGPLLKEITKRFRAEQKHSAAWYGSLNVSSWMEAGEILASSGDLVPDSPAVRELLRMAKTKMRSLQGTNPIPYAAVRMLEGIGSLGHAEIFALAQEIGEPVEMLVAHPSSDKIVWECLIERFPASEHLCLWLLQREGAWKASHKIYQHIWTRTAYGSRVALALCRMATGEEFQRAFSHLVSLSPVSAMELLEESPENPERKLRQEHFARLFNSPIPLVREKAMRCLKHLEASPIAEERSAERRDVRGRSR